MDIKNCKVTESVRTHARSVIGLILLIIATLLTIVTFSGLGIFAMFLVGVILCCRHQWGCGTCCECKCCSRDMECCDVETESTKKATKKSTAK